MGEDDIDVLKRISETSNPLSLKWKTKRGTGIRDQDTFVAKVRGDDAQEIIAEMNALIDGVATDQGGLLTAARNSQYKPEEEEELK